MTINSLKKISIGEIAIKDIKHVANSRFRNLDDVSELMSDIKNNGQLQRVGIRIKDNALIFGNRRVAACEKLGFEKIKCEYFDINSDTELMIMNLCENSRKNLTAVEYGRAINIMMKQNSKLTLLEVAAMLSKSPRKVVVYLQIYNIVVDTPYETAIVQGTKVQGVPEEFISRCYTLLSRTRINKRLSKRDWDILLEAAKNRQLTLAELIPLKKICFAKPNIQMEFAINLLKECKVISASLPFNEVILNHEMSQTKCTSGIEFVRHVIKHYNHDLLF